MNMDLSGRRALVCGASRGIGAAIAHALATLGASVTGVARNHAVLSDVIDALPKKAGQSHQALELDLTNDDALQVTAHEMADRPTHILVNNTGGPPPGPIRHAQRRAFETAMRQHLITNHLLTTTLAEGMTRDGYGRVINIISTSVKEPIAGLGVSNTVRAAVASWAKTLASELAPTGITVNNVLPGFTRTERLDEIFGARAEKQGITIDEARRRALATVPMGRLAEPEEIANAVAFLASPAAAYITGTNLTVDGGRTNSL
ncbi:MAG: SDR family oxidoreductase [Pseudomonadota bacterium]